MVVSNNLKRIMKEKGITAKYLAGKADISATHLSYVLNDKRNLSIELASKIADILGVNISQLFQEDENNLYTGIGSSPEIFVPVQKKPKDIMKILEQEQITINGELLSQEDIEVIKSAVEQGYYLAKRLNKRKQD